MDISQLRNPYDFRNPVRDAATFAGRREETEAIRYELGQVGVGRPSVCVVLYGPRAAGKTSLLNATDRMARDRGLTTVRVELIEGDGEPVSFFRKVYDELLYAIAEALRARDDDVPFEPAVVRRVMAGAATPQPDDRLEFPEAVALAERRGDTRVPESALRADVGFFVRLLGHPIALLVDEAQFMAEDARVLSVLRFLTTRVDGLVVVLAGTSGLMDQIRTVHSQILRQFKEIEVKRFVEHEDVEECVIQPLHAMGFSSVLVGRGVVTELMQLTDGNPYEIQLYCHEMFARMQQGQAAGLGLTPEVLEAIRAKLETGRNLMERPLIRAVREMKTSELTAFAILTSALGRATADQAWFAHIVAGEPLISREAYDNCHRALVAQGILTPDEVITLAVETELLDEIYVRVYTVSQLSPEPHGQFTGRGSITVLFVNRLLGLLHTFTDQHPLQFMPTCCPMMGRPVVEASLSALATLPDSGPNTVRNIDLVHQAVLMVGEPSALDLTSVTCRFGDIVVQRWLIASDVEDVILADQPDFSRAVDRIASLGGELTAERVRIPLRTWPAEEWFDLATGQLRADLAQSHQSAAYDAYDVGDRAGALRHFRRACELLPSWQYANALTHVSLSSHAPDEALQWSRTAMDLASRPVDRALSAYNAAIAHLMVRDPAAAGVLLARAADELRGIEVDEQLMGFLMVPAAEDPTEIREMFDFDLRTAVGQVREMLGCDIEDEQMPAKASGERAPVVLAVATEWASSHGGLSTLNRELCCALARAGAEVYCVVLDTTSDEVTAAGAAGVSLLSAPSAVGESDDMRLSDRPALPHGITPDLVVGHSRITGFAARRLVEAFYPEARRLHFLHMAPDEIEWHKPGRETDAGLRASERTEIERQLGAGAYRVVTVGPRLYDQFLAEFTTTPLLPLRLDPGFDIAVSLGGARTPPGGQPLRVLLLGRTEDSELKGVRLAAAACGQVDKWLRQDGEPRVRLVVRGAQPGTGERERDAISAFSGSPDFQVVVREYTAKEDAIEHDLETASLVLMPSRSEGFGLVGLEAITRGVPVLISSESGLGQLLRETLGKEANRFVVPVTGDANEDASVWARAVERILRDRDSAFKRVAELQALLAQKITWGAAAEVVLSQVASRA
ncbi:glycosyltransferase [Streptomyces subrutilus]|uniref:glycosyltransferase n=1 Tax=Streptomyces subrutilus TaxID=36818 RepID=UPI002E0DA65E|nr:glycosyltransferase [Streptomyces subrutilus]